MGEHDVHPGPDTDKVLNLIDVVGMQVRLAHLVQCDWCGKTTCVELLKGEGYEHLPTG